MSELSNQVSPEQFLARIELDSRADPTPNILALLAEFSPTIGRSPRGHLELNLVVPAADLRQALNTSAAAVGSAMDLEVLALEVGFPPPAGQVLPAEALWNDARAA